MIVQRAVNPGPGLFKPIMQLREAQAVIRSKGGLRLHIPHIPQKEDFCILKCDVLELNRI